jgi:hypothetical protein
LLNLLPNRQRHQGLTNKENVMSVQAALNNESLNSIPKIKDAISNAESFEANQMEQKAMSVMMNSSIAIVDMNNEQLE